MKIGFHYLRLAFLCAVASASATLRCEAQNVRTDTISFKVFFRQGHPELDLDFKDNRKTLKEFSDTVSVLLKDPFSNIKLVHVEGAASPEGGSVLNKDLAANRARNIKKWLVAHSDLESVQITTSGVGADWDGLYRKLEGIDWKYRDTVRSIIRNTPVWVTKGGKVVSGRKKRLMDLDGGGPWNWMLANIYPELRQGGSSIKCYVIRSAEPIVVRDTVVIHTVDTVYVPGPGLIPGSTGNPCPTVIASPAVIAGPTGDLSRKLIFAVRSNLLAPLMNIGLEIPFGDRWSVGLDWYYTWAWRYWSRELDMTNCFQMLSGGTELRYWLNPSKDPLTGHSVGAYIYGGYYDFERRFHGYQGEYFNFGLDYSYAALLSKRSGLRMEFFLGFGYIHSDAREYNVYTPGGKAFRTGYEKPVDWIGPTKAGVSLVIPIYKKVRN